MKTNETRSIITTKKISKLGSVDMATTHTFIQSNIRTKNSSLNIVIHNDEIRITIYGKNKKPITIKQHTKDNIKVINFEGVEL